MVRPDAPTLRLASLPDLHVHRAPRQPWAWVVAAICLGLYAWALSCYWAPAHPGVDQNGYLVGGKLLAHTGSTGVIPPDDFAFVGNMWNLAKDGKTYYPKYPLGQPVVVAALVKTLGDTRGTWASFLISPVATLLGLIATFLMARRVAGDVVALLACLSVAVSPITMGLANNPNSHALDMAVVAWAMLFLWKWVDGGKLRWIIPAGLFFGWAATIRYTEGLLVLPLLLAIAARWWRIGWGVTGDALLGLLAWALPIAGLVAFNLHRFGVVTGYDSTGESTGFGWQYFADNWDLMFRDLSDKGLFLLFPLGLVGLGILWNRRRTDALLLASWIIPSMILYGSYYWAPDRANSIAYGRFFLSVLPGLAVAGAATVASLAALTRGARVMVMLVVGIGAGVCAVQSAESQVGEGIGMLSAARAASAVLKHVPAGSTVFSDQNVLHNLQFVGDYNLYATNAFTQQAVRRWQAAANRSPDQPDPLQPDRGRLLVERYGNMNDRELSDQMAKHVSTAFADHKRVFVLATKSEIERIDRTIARLGFRFTKPLDDWQNVADLRPPVPAGNGMPRPGMGAAGGPGAQPGMVGNFIRNRLGAGGGGAGGRAAGGRMAGGPGGPGGVGGVGGPGPDRGGQPGQIQQLVEMVLIPPPPPKPATRPIVKPATKPAQ